MKKCDQFVGVLALSGGADHAETAYEVATDLQSVPLTLPQDEELVACNIFTMGEIAMLCPEHITERMLLSIRALVTPSPHGMALEFRMSH